MAGSSQLQTPIIVFDLDDPNEDIIGIYDSIRDAEFRIEPLWAHPEFIRGFDGAGRLLSIKCVKEPKRFWGKLFSSTTLHTRVSLAEDEPSHQEDLRRRLRHALTVRDLELPAKNILLSELVAHAQKTLII